MSIIPNYPQTAVIETYHGLVLTLEDALLILEGTCQNLLSKRRKRLNDFERLSITLGTIFVWCQTKGGMQRWTDGRSWLPSKVKGPFLIYYELDKSRNLLPNGLVKQTLSLTTTQNEKLHLVCYYKIKERMEGILPGKIPSKDPLLSHLRLDPNAYLILRLRFRMTRLPMCEPFQAYSSAQTYFPVRDFLYTPSYSLQQFQYCPPAMSMYSHMAPMTPHTMTEPFYIPPGSILQREPQVIPQQYQVYQHAQLQARQYVDGLPTCFTVPQLPIPLSKLCLAPTQSGNSTLVQRAVDPRQECPR